MTSFQITIAPNRRAAGRFISKVRRDLIKALAEEKAHRGVTQSQIARNIGVHRSVINRELKGRNDITLGRVAELAWALGREINFELLHTIHDKTQNITHEYYKNVGEQSIKYAFNENKPGTLLIHDVTGPQADQDSLAINF